MFNASQNQLSLESAREVFATEIKVLEDVQANLDENFEKAVAAILKTQGRVVVTGMGKSGHIGAKIAATLASTGTPAFFVHPAEMGHGDLGMLKKSDLVLALSFSGNTEELRKVLPPIKKLGLLLLSITARKDSKLAEFSDIVLETPIEKEACPLDLAPTSSTTAALVMGDALAVALMQHKNFKQEDFARSHPLGSLGRSFVQISELMRVSAVPQVLVGANLQEILAEIDSKSFGFTCVCDTDKNLVGVITDGDLRRSQITYGVEIFSKTAEDLMNKNPKFARPELMASVAAEIMKKHRISSLVIIDQDNKPLGVLDLKDLLDQGFVI